MLRTLRLATAVLIVLAVLAGPTAASTTESSQCNVAAHRGDTSTGYVENGLGALREAVAHGAQWLEVDVRVTSNGAPMLMHDPSVNRTTNGTGLIVEKTAAQVRGLRMDDGYVPPYTHQVLDLAKSANVRVLLDLKASAPLAAYDTLAAQIVSAGVARVVVTSTSPTRLARMRDALPSVQTAIVRYSDQPSPAQIAAWNGDGLVIDQSQTDDSYLAMLGGVPVYVFLVDDPAVWEHLAGKVDATLTSDVSGYVAARTTLCPTP